MTPRGKTMTLSLSDKNIEALVLGILEGFGKESLPVHHLNLIP